MKLNAFVHMLDKRVDSSDDVDDYDDMSCLIQLLLVARTA